MVKGRYTDVVQTYARVMGTYAVEMYGAVSSVRAGEQPKVVDSPALLNVASVKPSHRATLYHKRTNSAIHATVHTTKTLSCSITRALFQPIPLGFLFFEPAVWYNLERITIMEEKDH